MADRAPLDRAIELLREHLSDCRAFSREPNVAHMRPQYVADAISYREAIRVLRAEQRRREWK